MCWPCSSLRAIAGKETKGVDDERGLKTCRGGLGAPWQPVGSGAEAAHLHGTVVMWRCRYGPVDECYFIHMS